MLDERSGTGPTILALGSVNADFQVRVERRPDLSETLIGRDFLRTGGGKAANVAFLARRLGLDAVLLGHVGQDDLVEQALASLREAGVDLSRVVACKGQQTAVSMINVPPDGKKGIVLAPNANAAWTDDDVCPVEDAVAEAPDRSALVVDCEVPAFVAEAAVAAAATRELACVLDPSPADEVSDRLLASVDVVVPNPTEAETLTGIGVDDARSAALAARRLQSRGPSVVCAKLQGGGCIVAEAERLHEISGPSVEIVDTTGAGDAFAGAFAVALAEGREVVEAARWASAAATHAVTGYGSQPSYPTRADLDRMAARITANRYELDGD